MNESTARFETAGEAGNAVVHRVRGGVARIIKRVPTKLRWLLSTAAGLVMPVGWVADSAAKPLAEVCLGNGDIMALVAAANALTLIP
jgi:hypothetical protein